MIALFKQKSPANLALLLIFGLLIKMPYLLHPQMQQVSASDGVLYPFLVRMLGFDAGLSGSAAAFALLYSQALMINYAVNEHRLTIKHSFLPAMAYLLITSLLPEWNYFSPALLASTFIIWNILNLFRLYNVPQVSGLVFNIGFIQGLTALLFFPSALFILCLLLGLLILRPFRLNEIILLILGVLTPFYFYSIYLFLNGSLAMASFVPPYFFKSPQINNSVKLAVAAVFLALPFMVGSFHIQAQLRKMLIQVRKNWTIMLMYLVLSLGLPFISNNQNSCWVLALPAFAAFHACAYLYPVKKWLPLLLFWLTLAFILAQQYGLFQWKSLGETG